jgi:steroid delta-isomerase-like uncharacterized protein
MKKTVQEIQLADTLDQRVAPRRRLLGQLAGVTAAVPLGLLAPAQPAQAASDLKKNFLGMIKAWNDHDSAKIASYFIDDCTYTDIALEVAHHGKKEVIAFADGTFIGFPDFEIVIKSCFAGQDSVAAEWDMIMSWKGPYPSLGPTPDGKTYRLKGASVSHFNKAGKIIGNTDYWNLNAFIQQMKKS